MASQWHLSIIEVVPSDSDQILSFLVFEMDRFWMHLKKTISRRSHLAAGEVNLVFSKKDEIR
jgi:hypothetical protein